MIKKVSCRQMMSEANLWEMRGRKTKVENQAKESILILMQPTT